MEKKKIITDPFMGEIELIKVGETNRNQFGESIVDSIFKDTHGNYWIETWTTFGSDVTKPLFLRKELVEELCRIYKK
jgi:hypothetical protein